MSRVGSRDRHADGDLKSYPNMLAAHLRSYFKTSLDSLHPQHYYRKKIVNCISISFATITLQKTLFISWVNTFFCCSSNSSLPSSPWMTTLMLLSKNFNVVIFIRKILELFWTCVCIVDKCWWLLYYIVLKIIGRYVIPSKMWMWNENAKINNFSNLS